MRGPGRPRPRYPVACEPPPRQRGAYATEFALVFLLFFAVVYGLITYGLIFTAQQSLNLAAQDGARAALRWQQGGEPLLARAAAARDVALDRARWVQAMAGAGALQVAVCDAGGLLSGNGACSGQALPDRALEVVLRYPYAQAPLVPTFSRLLVPGALASRSIVRLFDAGPEGI